MKPRIRINSPGLPALALESIDETHLDALRGWKNAFRHRFFHQDEISATRQREWYSGYLDRPDDWMFIIRWGGQVEGCIGYRIIDGGADIYNLLRDPNPGRRSLSHAHAADLLTNYIACTHDLPVRGRCLVGNPVIRWAHKRGFRTIGRSMQNGLAYELLEQDPTRRVRYSVLVERREASVSIVSEALP